MNKVKHNNKNYILGIINGILFKFAFAVTGSETILPVFVSTLTSSGVLIGLAGSMQMALWPLPQIFMANYLEGKKYKMFVYKYTAYVRIIAMFAMGIVILWYPSFILPVFMLFLFIYLTAGGMSGISFMELIGKTISKRRLASFWGFRQAGGGALAILGGLFVKFSLDTYDYPFNYALLFLASGFVVTIALISFIMADEPPSRGQEPSKGFRHFFKTGVKVLRRDSAFKRLFSYKVLMAVAMGPVPFYAIFSLRILDVHESTIGLFIAIQMVGMILSNIVWDRVSKFLSTKYIMIITAGIVLLQPIFASLSPLLGIWMMYIVFFLVGASMSGIRVGYLTYLLEIAPESKRPTYIGFMNTFTAPMLFYPMINGLLVDIFSFTPTFIISAFIALIAGILIAGTRNA
ncbi:MAG: MFS transporter [candidate division WOR-3 bacterium]|nr:MFS transporter [candidate division WOR-3 bacterium]